MSEYEKQHEYYPEGKILVRNKLYLWSKKDKNCYEIRDSDTNEFIEFTDSLDSFRIDKEAE